MALRDYASPLLDFVSRLEIPKLRQLAKQPGIQAVYRIVTYHADRHARHVVATITRTQYNDLTLEVIYEGVANHRPFTHDVSFSNYEKLLAVFQQVDFDQLSDQPKLPIYNRDLWMIERAAGTFYHCVVMSPDTPQKPYVTLINAVDAYIPEAVREVSR